MGDSRSAYWDDYTSCDGCGGDLTWKQKHLCPKGEKYSFFKLKPEELEKYKLLSDYANVDAFDTTINYLRGHIRTLKDEILAQERYIEVLEYFKHVRKDDDLR